MQTKQIDLLLQQLKLLYPAAFRRNYLFYGQIKTKGILSDLKELIPWVLAAMIFVPISLVLKDVYSSKLSTAPDFQAQAYAILTILLFLMLVVPLVIKQIRHSSHSLYQFLRHTPIKLTVVIVLEALNLVFLQSSTTMWILFFSGSVLVLYGSIKKICSALLPIQLNNINCSSYAASVSGLINKPGNCV